MGIAKGDQWSSVHENTDLKDKGVGGMKTEFAIKKLNEVKSRLNILTLTCAGLIFVCVILSITVMHTSNNQKIILVPPAAKGQMEVNNGHFSPDYIWVIQTAVKPLP